MTQYSTDSTSIYIYIYISA